MDKKKRNKYIISFILLIVLGELVSIVWELVSFVTSPEAALLFSM